VLWPSLAPQVSLAQDLYGSAGRLLIDKWLDVQVARIDDLEFGRSFADHLDLPGIAAADYNHRLLRTSRGGLLGGIRFYGRDVERPFVEVVGHGFGELGDLCACVRAEWSAFDPRYLRLHGLPGTLTGPNVLRDKTVHLARYRNMAPPHLPVSLEPFGALDEAVSLVTTRYDGLDPVLRRNVAPATEDVLGDLHANGRLRAAVLGGQTVGLFAAAPGAITWLIGDEVMEEVVDARFAGRGIASAMQGEWARSVAGAQDRYLIGTIDRHNAVSRRTAERAGRPTVMESVFVEL
jgi:hypothetical protein